MYAVECDLNIYLTIFEDCKTTLRYKKTTKADSCFLCFSRFFPLVRPHSHEKTPKLALNLFKNRVSHTRKRIKVESVKDKMWREKSMEYRKRVHSITHQVSIASGLGKLTRLLKDPACHPE